LSHYYELYAESPQGERAPGILLTGLWQSMPQMTATTFPWACLQQFVRRLYDLTRPDETVNTLPEI
jgi:hypothetical protein